MSNEEDALNAFLLKDLQRISDRCSMQEQACKRRELALANNIDGKERDALRDQLINYRRLCRNNNNSGSVLDGNNSNNDSNVGNSDVPVRVLHASLDTAQAKAFAQSNLSAREVARRIEEAHDWLCWYDFKPHNALIKTHS